MLLIQFLRFIISSTLAKTVQSRVQEHRSYENHTRRLRLFERRWKVGTIGQRKHHDHASRQIITKARLPSLLWRVSSNFPILVCFRLVFVRISCRDLLIVPAELLQPKMNFSELFKQTNQLSKFSPNGKYMVILWSLVSDCCTCSSHEVMYVSIQVNVQSKCT